ncbi:metal-dependent hydrolase [Sphingorhabdus arenilitoris]|uniref:Metal-dependent hydrolase n=1 Tax=Sphingorhabdus arenilitoris TaxID=1490041 RepID=A0ABV8RDZ6_9SPHN
MPTILTHAIIPLAAGVALGKGRLSGPVVMTGMALAMLPDADVAGFRFGIEYLHDFGHRGASHALLSAAAIAALVTALMRPERWRLVFAFLFFSMASHGLLDIFTNGGEGVALFWPYDNSRIFAPIRPIAVSPIGLDFFTLRGLHTLISEISWVWLPALVIMLIGRATIPKTGK